MKGSKIMPITYKCASCGGIMEFDSVSQKLKCLQCGNTKDIETMETDNLADRTVNQECENTIDMKLYHCKSCGAELVTDEFTAATICSFCGNPSLVGEQIQGVYKPQRIIPFKMNKEEAQQKYREWIKKGILTPKELKDKATIEKISGVYVPYWLYDYKAQSQMTANAEIVNVERKGEYEITYHKEYQVYRDVSAEFNKVPADASKNMEDSVMDKLEPFRYEELKPFAMEYMSGYLSERYSVSAEEMRPHVEKRIDNYITDITKDTITGYSHVNVVSNHINKVKKSVEYIMIPVWLLNCRYNSKDFQFMINGQTGKIVADRPISIQKCILAAISTFLLSLLLIMAGDALLFGKDVSFIQGMCDDILIKLIIAIVVTALVIMLMLRSSRAHMTVGSSTYAGDNIRIGRREDTYIRTRKTERKIENNSEK